MARWDGSKIAKTGFKNEQEGSADTTTPTAISAREKEWHTVEKPTRRSLAAQFTKGMRVQVAPNKFGIVEKTDDDGNVYVRIGRRKLPYSPEFLTPA